MTNHTPDANPGSADPGTPGRQCARCRHHFPIEAGTDPIELIGWWTCHACSAALLPTRSRATTP